MFAPDELAIVLSHYDVGVIDSISDFPRGSRKAPKLLVVAEQGKFLLKRRAHGKDDPFKVAFSHGLQLFLAGKQFPLPHLLGTRRDNNSMLQWHNGVYEMFEYIPGQGYPQTLESTFDAGRVLALYHKLLEDFKSEWRPPGGSYHMASAIESGLKTIAANMPVGPNNENADVHHLLNHLFKSYRHAAELRDRRAWNPGREQSFMPTGIRATCSFATIAWWPSSTMTAPAAAAVIDIANGLCSFPSSAATTMSPNGRNIWTSTGSSVSAAAMMR